MLSSEIREEAVPRSIPDASACPARMRLLDGAGREGPVTVRLGRYQVARPANKYWAARIPARARQRQHSRAAYPQSGDLSLPAQVNGASIQVAGAGNTTTLCAGSCLIPGYAGTYRIIISATGYI